MTTAYEPSVEAIEERRDKHLTAERALAISEGAEMTEEEDIHCFFCCDDCCAASMCGEFSKSVLPS
jgi:hypothetical protein